MIGIFPYAKGVGGPPTFSGPGSVDDGYAMQNEVNVNSSTMTFVETFSPCAFNDFFNGKVGSRRLLTMEECRGNPHYNPIARRVYRLSRKNCVTRCISTRRAGGSLTLWPRPGNAMTSTYFPASMSALMTVRVLAKCTLSSPVPWAIRSLLFSSAAYFTGEESR